MISEYCNSLTPIKELCAKYQMSDRCIYEAIKNGEIDKRGRSPSWTDVLDIEKELFFYLLGLIASDGCLHKNYKTIEISLHDRDIDILNKLSAGLFNQNRVIHEKHRNRARLLISSGKSTAMFCSYGITPAKSETLKINFDMIPVEHFYHFLRGYIDGDGSYTYKNENNIHVSICGNEYMMKKFQKYVLKYYGLESNVYKINEDISFPYYRWTIQKTPLVKELIKILYKDANYYIERKYNIIKSVLNSAV